VKKFTSCAYCAAVHVFRTFNTGLEPAQAATGGLNAPPKATYVSSQLTTCADAPAPGITTSLSTPVDKRKRPQ